MEHALQGRLLQKNLYTAFAEHELPELMRGFPDSEERQRKYRRDLLEQVKPVIERALAGDACAASRAISMAPNQYRGYILVLFYLSGIPLAGYREALESAWAHDHREVIRAAANRQRLRAMFRKAQFPLPEHLPDVVRLWRGTSFLPLGRAVRGVSWTTDRDVACWFALRFAECNGNPLVLVADVPKTAILHFSNGREETEAVCFDVGTPRVDGTPEDWQAGRLRHGTSSGVVP